MEKIILASGSPRRKQLLEWAEICFEIIVSDAEETFPEGMLVKEVPVHIAEKKARAVSNGNRTVLAADTIVVLENEVIGKPVDREDALNILRKLSDKEHSVITGVVIMHRGSVHRFYDETRVTFHKMSEKDIIFYVDKYKPFDKAGAYAIQEWIGVAGIKRIEGDFYNVMGLPVSRVIQKLRELGFTFP